MPKMNQRARNKQKKIEIKPAESNVEINENNDAGFEETVSNPRIPPKESAGILGNKIDLSSPGTDLPLRNASPLDEPDKTVDVSPSDDPLTEFRQALFEEETLKTEKQEKKWWRRTSTGSRNDIGLEADGNIESQADFPAGRKTSPDAFDVGNQEENQPEESLEAIDDLIEKLDIEIEDEADPSGALRVNLPSEPNVNVEFDDLKKQVFQPRSVGAESDISSEVRSLVMEGGEEVFVEVQSKHKGALSDRVAAVENALKPYRRYIYFMIAFLGIVITAGAFLFLFNIYKQMQPPKPVDKVNFPFPTAMSLPGGLNFSLGKGTLTDGKWDPDGPEWLEGTEVCRWISIPWSLQLEAVIQTLNPGDRIVLEMSNNDKFIYTIDSVRQLGNEHLQALETDSPCLLLVLAEADSDTRWVLIAFP